jgi:hypothetical protein
MLTSAGLSDLTVIVQEEETNNTQETSNNKVCKTQVEKNLYRSSCCSTKNYVDKRMLGFFAQCGVSFAVLGFSMSQIINSEKGEDLTIYYTLIGSIVGNFVPSYHLQKNE